MLRWGVLFTCFNAATAAGSAADLGKCCDTDQPANGWKSQSYFLVDCPSYPNGRVGEIFNPDDGFTYYVCFGSCCGRHGSSCAGKERGDTCYDEERTEVAAAHEYEGNKYTGGTCQTPIYSTYDAKYICEGEMEVGGGGGGDSPCFGREMHACLLTDTALTAAAFNVCFGDATDVDGVRRVPLAELRAGDLVLDSVTSASRVIVNEHVHSPHKATLLNIETADGQLVVTPDHYISTATGFAAAGKAGTLVGSSGAVSINRTSVKMGKVVNPITVSGKILVATATGAPFLATTYGGWIAETALRFGSILLSTSLSNGLSFLFPVSAQTYHDAVIEPIAPSKAVFSLWSLLFTATPVVFHPIAFIVLDLAVAASFVVWTMCSFGGAAIVAVAVLKLRAHK